jgi:hypothetical protein
MESTRGREDDAPVVLARTRPELNDPTEVRDVLGNEGSAFDGCVSKEVLVRHGRKDRVLGCGGDIVATLHEPIGGMRGVMYVEQQPHRARRSRRRRHAASASSAAARLAAILSSISAW